MTNESHLTDEDLSALIDGEHPGGARVHLEGCETCSARLEAMRRVVTAVAAPPPSPSPSERAAAVARAVAGPSKVRSPAALLGAVAAVVALLLGGAALLTRDGGGGSHETAARDASRREFAAGSAGGAVSSGDLGDVADAAALRQALVGRLDAASDAAAPTAAGAPSGDLKTTTGAAGPDCQSQAQEIGGAQLGALLFTGTLRYERKPAVVFVYTAPGQSLTRRVFVMASADCQLLVAQSF